MDLPDINAPDWWSEELTDLENYMFDTLYLLFQNVLKVQRGELGIDKLPDEILYQTTDAIMRAASVRDPDFKATHEEVAEKPDTSKIVRLPGFGE